MKRLLTCLAAVVLLSCATLHAREAALTVHTDDVAGQVDERVYGHFLEHIYHSVNGGLWGDLVWNRTFERPTPAWSVQDGALVQESMRNNVRLLFGEENWQDYTFTLEAKKTGGQEGFLLLFRVAGEEDFYWANLGGWGNEQHAIEKGVAGQGRWGVVGPQVSGSIEQGRWYEIKVRCRDNHFQVWLDGQKVLDYTDEENPHLSGRVGVGTWSTQARFRNVRVEAPDGEVLYRGLPDRAVTQPELLNWETFGPGTVRRTGENPLNCERAVRITGEEGRTGLSQQPYCAREGETYHGSLWTRGEAAEMTVAFVDGGDVLDEAELDVGSDDWQQHEFTLRPDRTAREATLRIAAGGGTDLWLDQVRLMSQSARETGGYRPDLLKAVKELRPPVLRWPGGIYASEYRWKDGIGPQHQRKVHPQEMWDDRDPNAFGTDEFLRLCEKVGAEPVLVINVTEGVEYAKDWVRYCNAPRDTKWGRRRAENGHPDPYNVKYWEIDNETWGYYGMSAEEYSAHVRTFAPALKEVDPDIETIACGSGSFDAEWNRTVVEQAGGHFDYLSVHHYEDPNRYGEGARRYEQFLRETARMIDNSDHPNIEIYVSEWNAQSTDWRTGLYAGGMLNGFERLGDSLTMGGPALFLRHVSATGWDNAFINFDQCSWYPAPNYVVMKLWRDHYAPNRLRMTGERAGLNVVATASGDGDTVHVKVVNPAEEAVEATVELAGDLGPLEAEMEVVAPGSLDARNTLQNARVVRPRRHEVELSGGNARVTVPALSAGVLTVHGGPQ